MNYNFNDNNTNLEAQEDNKTNIRNLLYVNSDLLANINKVDKVSFNDELSFNNSLIKISKYLNTKFNYDITLNKSTLEVIFK